MEALIDVQHVWKLYGKFVANEDISLTLYKGEIVSLLGPNGAGKTTLVKQLYGELLPNKGKITVLGNNPTNRKIMKSIGIIPQEVQPYEDLTVWDNIYYLGKIKGVKTKQIYERGEDLLRKLELLEKRNTLAMKLSGGMKRKLLLATSLINDPKLVILDEPTTGLDARARREVWNILLGLKKEGKSILLTTHYLDEAEKLSDRIYFINRKIVIEGLTSEIKEKFSDWYELIDYDSGKTIRIKGEDELKKVISNLNGKFEVRLPSLEEIYLEVFKDVS
ncbi:ABC transporter ATP-binding protein [Candidatus Acidianus copahuensis]|uniref:MarR family transcriptional regulator n=1 Tax=Candidatus Acidianus copahuensis TaxID=1160895 RepID=A0A031LW66_9CREN|nr:ABC transporter ATP-binding protein [Candidatus Acidianus copahuensis]EZQ12051.1 MarR family transcriptional regulator [Candidatus Acidianus copahuensis]NON62266.1 ABC transporter ATP-binding protein [Acidianus sp. RZ1]